MAETTTGREHIAELFTELANEEVREYIRGDFATRTPATLAGEFAEAVRVLEGLVVMAEGLSMGTYTVLSDARRRAAEARERAEAAL